jgi:hypothetical protein
MYTYIYIYIYIIIWHGDFLGEHQQTRPRHWRNACFDSMLVHGCFVRSAIIAYATSHTMLLLCVGEVTSPLKTNVQEQRSMCYVRSHTIWI